MYTKIMMLHSETTLIVINLMWWKKWVDALKLEYKQKPISYILGMKFFIAYKNKSFFSPIVQPNQRMLRKFSDLWAAYVHYCAAFNKLQWNNVSGIQWNCMIGLAHSEKLVSLTHISFWNCLRYLVDELKNLSTLSI